MIGGVTPEEGAEVIHRRSPVNWSELRSSEPDLWKERNLRAMLRSERIAPERSYN